MNPILDFVKGLAQPVADVVDELHTSEEEKLSLSTRLFELQVGVYNKVMEYEARLVEAQAKIITTEAESENWITANWRPLTMLIFVALVVNKWTGLTALLGVPTVFIDPAIELELWATIKLGLGGYVAGRSLEKIAPAVAEAIGNMKKV